MALLDIHGVVVSREIHTSIYLYFHKDITNQKKKKKALPIRKKEERQKHILFGSLAFLMMYGTYSLPFEIYFARMKK